jgi:hypothetical protein
MCGNLRSRTVLTVPWACHLEFYLARVAEMYARQAAVEWHSSASSVIQYHLFLSRA